MSRTNDAVTLARQLENFELYLRPCFKRTAWFDCLGQGHLTRIYGKEDARGSEAKKLKERSQKLAQAKEDEDRFVFQNSLHNPDSYFSKNKSPLLTLRIVKLAALKGEEYRNVRRHTGKNKG